MYPFCKNTSNTFLTSDGLVSQIDISDARSWDLNTGLTIQSISSWANSVTTNKIINDFGLTAYDNGRVNDMFSFLDLENDSRVKLYRVGVNDSSGNTLYNDYQIDFVTGNTGTGNYFDLNGGYLQGFFKLNEYQYHVLPERFNKGFTFETLLNVENFLDEESIFLYVGTRAEDKYNKSFSGETEQTIVNKTKRYDNGYSSPDVVFNDTGLTFQGVQTSLENNLTSIKNDYKRRNTFVLFSEQQVDNYNYPSQRGNLENNVLAFYIKNRKVGVKYINHLGIVNSIESNINAFTSSGWTLVSITYQPDEIFDQTLFDNNKECLQPRDGVIKIYVNGSLKLKAPLKEFYSQPLSTKKELQLGVPYTISWGGGSFGLEHSFHYDFNTRNIFKENDQSYVDLNFDVVDNPLIEDKCKTGNTNQEISLLSNNTEFFVTDECNPNITSASTVLQVLKTGSTDLKSYYFEYNQSFELLPYREYSYTLDIYNPGIFDNTNNLSQNNVIEPIVYGTSDIEITYKKIYKNDGLVDNTLRTPYPIIPDEYQYVAEDKVKVWGDYGIPAYTGNLEYDILRAKQEYPNYNDSIIISSALNQWITLEVKFKLLNTDSKENMFLGLGFNTNDSFVSGFTFYVDNIKLVGQDKLTQYTDEDNDIISSNFNSSFKGGIQKLRIYEKPLSIKEITQNVEYESLNKGNTMTQIKGGRLIMI